MTIPCTPYTLPVNSGCVVYLFAPDFRDWVKITDSCGNDVFMIAFGNTAAGPLTDTTCARYILNDSYPNIIRAVDNCGQPALLIGFDGSPFFPSACQDNGTGVG
jgi:hypothetical protein